MNSLRFIIICCSILLVLSSCSSPAEVLEIGEPNTEYKSDEDRYEITGFTITDEIEDTDKIEEIKNIRKYFEKMNQPTEAVYEEPDLYFQVNNKEEYTVLATAFVWFLPEGSSIIRDLNGSFYELDAEHTVRLKEIVGE
ncbi:hypothetical protein EQV77_13360 [Halobacillus fulvus]|nr:hypothetical protein EQV77_13360 [Halobacillus fulvus]